MEETVQQELELALKRIHTTHPEIDINEILYSMIETLPNELGISGDEIRTIRLQRMQIAALDGDLVQKLIYADELAGLSQSEVYSRVCERLRDWGWCIAGMISQSRDSGLNGEPA
ncbi:MAG: hypothetical protein AAGH53_00235 [Pseudomonadota bacterium]